MAILHVKARSHRTGQNAGSSARVSHYRQGGAVADQLNAAPTTTHFASQSHSAQRTASIASFTSEEHTVESSSFADAAASAGTTSANTLGGNNGPNSQAEAVTTPSNTASSASTKAAAETAEIASNNGNTGGEVNARDVIDPRIDVRAQFALLRLFDLPDVASVATYLLDAVHSGEIQGIYGDDLGVAAQVAAQLNTVRWSLVPSDQDAVQLVRGDNSAPFIFFKESAGKQGRLDEALLDVAQSNAKAPPNTKIPGVQPTQTCVDGTVDNSPDSLPPLFMPVIVPVPPDQMLTLVNTIIDWQNKGGGNQPKLTLAPLGFTWVLMPGSNGIGTSLPVNVHTEGDGNCKKCVADWNATRPLIILFIMQPGYFVEEKRFFVEQGDPRHNTSGCNYPNATLLEVRKVIQPDVVPATLAAEFEHWADAQRAFDLTVGRYLANVNRLNSARTHLVGRDQAQCEHKVAVFLDSFSDTPGMVFAAGDSTYLQGFSGLAFSEFNETYSQSGTTRDTGGQHKAIPTPANDRKPFFPNIDTQKNPFGCAAYWRRFDKNSSPGIPGPDSTKVVADQNMPPKMPWHVM